MKKLFLLLAFILSTSLSYAQQVPDLDAIDAVAGGDLFYCVDASDTTDRVEGTGKKCTATQIGTAIDTNTNASTICSGSTTYLDGEGNCDDISSTYAAALGVDDNYVTDAEKTVIGNTSGTNTGDQAAGAGLSGTSTLATASNEENFLISGALTCGAGTAGKVQVHTTPIQYCDNAATPALQYGAYGDSTGDALAGDSATSFFNAGQIERARGGTGTDTSAYAGGLFGTTFGGLMVDVDTISELEAQMASPTNILIETEIDGCSELKALLDDETGNCGGVVFSDTPTLITPVLGVATATSINKVAITTPATSATLTIADGKTLTATNTVNLNTMTDGKWCSYSSTGTVINCTNDAPAGSGDITDVFSCASGDCASITMAATDLLDMSGTDASTATEGLILPQHATACAGGTAEGQVCWEADAHILHIGTSAALVDFVPTSAFSGEATVSTTGAVTLAETGISLTSITVGALLGVDSIDATGAVDMDYGSADITDHTFTSDGGTVIIDGNINSSTLNASEIVVTDGSKNIVSAAVATYPSLTELTYVKGVTSAIQTQLARIPAYHQYTLLPQGAVLDDGSPPAVSIFESTGTNTPRFYGASFDAATDEIVYWTIQVPSDMAAGDWLLDVSWGAGDVGPSEAACWGASLSATTEGDVDDILEQAGDTINYACEDVNETEATRLMQTTITMSNLDSVAAGDLVILIFRRDADGTGGTDDLTSDATLVSARLRIPR